MEDQAFRNRNALLFQLNAKTRINDRTRFAPNKWRTLPDAWEIVSSHDPSTSTSGVILCNWVKAYALLRERGTAMCGPKTRTPLVLLFTLSLGGIRFVPLEGETSAAELIEKPVDLKFLGSRRSYVTAGKPEIQFS